MVAIGVGSLRPADAVALLVFVWFAFGVGFGLPVDAAASLGFFCLVRV